MGSGPNQMVLDVANHGSRRIYSERPNSANSSASAMSLRSRIGSPSKSSRASLTELALTAVTPISAFHTLGCGNNIAAERRSRMDATLPNDFPSIISDLAFGTLRYCFQALKKTAGPEDRQGVPSTHVGRVDHLTARAGLLAARRRVQRLWLRWRRGGRGQFRGRAC